MTREEAIDLLDNIIGFVEDSHGSDYDKALKMAIEALELVTSYESTINKLTEALNQQKEGHWIGIDEEPHEDYECDKCGYVVSTFTANIEPHTEYKYCPNCGVKMKGDKE